MGQNALTTMLLHQSEAAAPLSEASLGKTFPVALEQIVAKMLKKFPADRYSNIGLVALDLSAVGGDSAKTPSRFASAPQAKTPSSVSNKKNAYAVALATSAIGVAIVTGLIGYGLGQFNPHSTEPVVQTVKSEEPRTPLESIMSGKTNLNDKNIAPVESKLRSRNGALERVFSFPHVPLGMVRWPVGNSFVSRWAHEEDVFMPAGTAATFELDALKYPALLDNPDLFWRIGPTEFTGLTIKGGRVLDAATAISILKAASTWTALQSLTLQDFPGDKSVLMHVNELKNLREVRLARLTNVDAKWIAGQPFIMRAESLDLSDCDVAPLISNEARGNLLLHSLSLEDTNVTAEALRELSGCPSLITLVLDMKTLSDDQVEALTQIKSLITIVFKSTVPDEKQLKILLANSRIRVVLPSKCLNASRRDALKKLDPHRVSFEELK
jgi:hypothetical protein